MCVCVCACEKERAWGRVIGGIDRHGGVALAAAKLALGVDAVGIR